VTVGWVVNAEPPVAPDGWVVTDRLVAGPAVTVKVALSAVNSSVPSVPSVTWSL
jgi:hypothetical protein